MNAGHWIWQGFKINQIAISTLSREWRHRWSRRTPTWRRRTSNPARSTEKPEEQVINRKWWLTTSCSNAAASSVKPRFNAPINLQNKFGPFFARRQNHVHRRQTVEYINEMKTSVRGGDPNVLCSSTRPNISQFKSLKIHWLTFLG